MKEIIKLLGAFSMGLGAGILVSQRFFKKKYESIADEEIAVIKSVYFSNEQVEKPKISAITEDTKDNVMILNSEGYSINDYETEREHPREEDIPYEITEEEFSETELSYEKLTLHYFVDDDVLFDPQEEAINGNGMVDDPLQVIGEDGLLRLRASDDTYALYFRNDTYGTDYEVKRMAGAYHA